MSIIKKLSNVLKEVFWIKSSDTKASSTKKTIRKTTKKAVKKTVKKKLQKASTVKVSKAVIVKEPKVPKATKAVKPVAIKTKVSKAKGLQLDEGLVAVGEITHYFERIKVCVVKITQGTVLIGDKLTMVGAKHKFVQKVWSMQIESVDVKVAKKGQLIGLKVDKPVAVGDVVYK